MKKAILALVLLATNAQAGGLLKKVDLSLCSVSGDRCVRIAASQGKSTELKPLFVFDNPTVFVKQNGVETEKNYSSGYVDFDNEQLVLRQDAGEREVSFNLRTLEQRNFATK